MMRMDRDALEQRLIEHEMRLSRARAALHDHLVHRQRRAELHGDREQADWLRLRIAEMIAAASLDELPTLGLDDTLVRELELGPSLRAAWERLCAPPPIHSRRRRDDARLAKPCFQARTAGQAGSGAGSPL
jgi:hypothetical protein